MRTKHTKALDASPRGAEDSEKVPFSFVGILIELI